MPDLEWHDLPEVPPAREASTRTVNGRRFHVLPTERVMVRVASDKRPHQAVYHHATKTFWTVGTERDSRLTDVTAWAFEPRNDAP
jgi:hypothetical protein